MSVWLWRFRTDLLNRRGRRQGAPPDERPALLVRRDGQRQVVGACCARAEAAGVRPGLPVGQARALFAGGSVRIEQLTPERDASALRALAVWAQRFSPVVAPDRGDGLLLDVSGCERVFKGEGRLLRAVTRDFATLGFDVRLAIAPTFACARAVARCGDKRGTIVPDGGQRRVLASLPVHALDLDEATLGALAEIGVERIEHLLNLPRALLPARFGGGLLLRLDRALGAALETIEPLRPVPPPRAERLFDGPTTQWEALEVTVRDLLRQVCAELASLESGAGRVDIELRRSDLDPARLALTLSRPSRDAAHLWSLARPKLERAHLGFGVEGVTIGVAGVRRLAHEQVERWRSGMDRGGGRRGGGEGDAKADAAAGQLADTLANRLGRERVYSARPVESHIPERAFLLTPPCGLERERHPASVTPADRPTVLLDPASPADVVALTPDGPVHVVRWRGQERRIVSSIGPERIGAEWWRAGADDEPTRDYFRVQDETGQWLWLRRDLETNRWSVHGVWG